MKTKKPISEPENATFRCQKQTGWHLAGDLVVKGSHILALLVPGMDCRKVILCARKLAGESSPWSVVYTRDPRSSRRNRQLTHDLELARRLDGDIVNHPGITPEKACAEAALKEDAVRIVVGCRKGWRHSLADTLRLRRLAKLCPDAEITVVPVNDLDVPVEKPVGKPGPDFSPASDRVRFFAVIVLAALAMGALCALMIGHDGAQYVAFGILVVLLFAIAAMRMGAILFFTILSAFVFTIMLVLPNYSLQMDFSREDRLFLLSFFVIVLANGALATKYRGHRRQAERQGRQANALFLVARKLSNAASLEEVVTSSRQEIAKLADMDIFFIFRDNLGELTNFQYVPAELTLSDAEIEGARFAFTHNCAAGSFTSHFNSSHYMFHPLNGPTLRLGVAAVKPKSAPDADKALFGDAMLDQIARTLEFHLAQQEARKAALLKESDKLYKTLFNSVSHELRSPLAAIIGATDILANRGCNDAMCKELCSAILKASGRLDRVIENLLNMSRLESGRIAANPVPCDIGDLLGTVANNLSEELAGFDLQIRVQPQIPAVRLDIGLTEQVLYNLVYNSCQYAPEGTVIALEASYADNWLELRETDCGPGFDADSLPQVFDKFWRKKDSRPGGLGLGLSIVKGFVEAQGGTVEAANRPDGGACFTIRFSVQPINTLEP